MGQGAFLAPSNRIDNEKDHIIKRHENSITLVTKHDY